MVHATDRATLKQDTAGTLVAIVGFLVAVELTSGILQGYYTPLYTDIARHLQIHDADVNWFEAAQLLVSALVVPGLARLADLLGHKRILLLSTGITALAAWAVSVSPTFWTFLLSWALMGPYTVWLPLEIAIVHRRTKGDVRRLRTAAAALVFALEFGVIAGALASGALSGSIGMTGLLAIPAVAVSLCFIAVLFGVPAAAPVATGRFDGRGLWLLTAALVVLMSGLMVIRLAGPLSAWPWPLLLLGAGLFLPFARRELSTPDPLVDLRVLSRPGQWPVQVTAGLFGMSVLGAQIPLSTFARTDPHVAGYGLGVSASGVSLLIGGYVLALAAGALCLPKAARRLSGRNALAVGAGLVAVGYAAFIVNHAMLAGMMVNMIVAGIGSGLLVAALPSAAASDAPDTHTGQMAGLTNMTKTIGGAFASSIFAICLSATGSVADPAQGRAPFGGYLAVWAICAASAAVAAVILHRRMPDGTDRALSEAAL